MTTTREENNCNNVISEQNKIKYFPTATVFVL